LDKRITPIEKFDYPHSKTNYPHPKTSNSLNRKLNVKVFFSWSIIKAFQNQLYYLRPILFVNYSIRLFFSPLTMFPSRTYFVISRNSCYRTNSYQSHKTLIACFLGSTLDGMRNNYKGEKVGKQNWTKELPRTKNSTIHTPRHTIHTRRRRPP
jgi:hypothetical protein